MSAPRSRALLVSRLSQVAVALILVSIGVNCSGPGPVKPTSHDGLLLGPKGTAVDASGFGSGTFYPLAIGNVWTYDGGGTLRYIQNGVPGEPQFEYAFTETHRLIGTTDHDGTQYFVEEQVNHQIPEGYYGPSTWWNRVRQDANGLYYLDTLLSAPPALDASTMRAPSQSNNTAHPLRIDFGAIRKGVAANPGLERLADRLEFMRGVVRGFARIQATDPTGLELRELVYPLRVGASWSIRPDFPWPAQVAGIEVLNTPAGNITAYRLDTNPFGTSVHEGEWARLYWPRQGFVGYSLHLFGEETDENGNPTGNVYVTDDSMFVSSIAIAK